MNYRFVFVFLLLVGVACRRPSAQIKATLAPTADSTGGVTKSQRSLSELTDFSRYLKAGDEFMAVGNEPSWSLTINPSKNSMRFKLVNGDSINTPVPQRTIDSNGRIRFDAETDRGRITALFRPDSCADKLSGQRYDYYVDVTVNGKTYVGCGASLRELSLLNDIWVLQTLNGAVIPKTADRSGPPRLVFQLTEDRVTGSTGCNRLTGSVQADTRRIRFAGLTTTRMACTDEANRTEGDFLEALSQNMTYSVADRILTLLHDGKPIMTFGKTD